MKTSKSYGLVSIVLIVLLCLSSFTSAGYVTEENIDYVPDQIVVLINQNTLGDREIEQLLTSQEIEKIEKLHDYDLVTSERNHGKRLFILHFSEGKSEQIIDLLLENPLVEMADFNYIGYVNMVPDDPYYSEQWALPKMNVPNAYDIELGKRSVVIASIDSGADLDHEDYASKILPGYDAVDDDLVPEDEHGHGTRMIGLTAANTNNGIGIAGMCTKCRLLPIRVADGEGGIYTSDVYKALEYAVGNPNNIEGIPDNPHIADVISMSFGFSYPSSYLTNGVNDAYAEGAVLVAAAGNDGDNDEEYPAAYSNVIAVAATNQDDERPSWSNYGDWVDVAAPGSQIRTTSRNNLYAISSGTSPATAIVAGLVGLIESRAIKTDIDQEDVREILIETSSPVTGFPEIVGGRLDAHKALIQTPCWKPNLGLTYDA
ncbi:S8 family serine peptidase [Candidatus Aenigmatarchaeota archaeon]